MSPIGPSIIRTVGAYVIGWLIALGIRAGFDISPDAWGAVIFPIVTVAYYVVVRFLETKVSPIFSFALLSNKQPVRYVPSDVVVAENKSAA
jgi:hypothetical protein